MKIRKAIIPAAGLGTRVLPASKSVPKEMLNIVDKPAIQYIVEEAARVGIEDILIITNRGKVAIEDHFDHSFELETQLAANPAKASLYESVKKCSSLANIYFIRQKETKGLGHAILAGKSFIGNEPCAILYGDDVIINDENPVIGQMCKLYEKYGKGMVGVKAVPEELIPMYCTLNVTPVEDEERLMNCYDIIEKPKPEQIMSPYAILGRVILPPGAMDMIERGVAETPEGKEFLFTDTLTELGRAGNLFAYDFDGRRYDMGNKLGMMKANCEVALDHPEIGAQFREYIKELASKL